MPHTSQSKLYARHRSRLQRRPRADRVAPPPWGPPPLAASSHPFPAGTHLAATVLVPAIRKWRVRATRRGPPGRARASHKHSPPPMPCNSTHCRAPCKHTHLPLLRRFFVILASAREGGVWRTEHFVMQFPTLRHTISCRAPPGPAFDQFRETFGMLIKHLNLLNQKKLVLASASPRRQELLRQLGLKFEVGGSRYLGACHAPLLAGTLPASMRKSAFRPPLPPQTAHELLRSIISTSPQPQHWRCSCSMQPGAAPVVGNCPCSKQLPL